MRLCVNFFTVYNDTLVAKGLNNVYNDVSDMNYIMKIISIRKPSVGFMKFASFSVVILTHQKPDSYSALASILVWVDQSDGNNYRLTGQPIPDY